MLNKHKNPFVRLAYLVAGIIFLIIGIIGVILPVMPGTIFLIISTVFFLRSSERLSNWMLNNKYFGKNIRTFLEKRAVPLRIKIIAISFMWLPSLFSVIFVLESNIGKAMILTSISAVTYYLISLKTLKEEEA